ncbi:RseA family anti-sigma factor [Cognatilysobacter bugurensis]|uniref:Anti sigma-E protein RseA N-terminal domain-containing protein n=1 Tax=Cognatilysobacter bugurensis TaxID=543356 RepID=A0A918W563_9GAMM|nr:RseA family anti-sigma factor [Lysobacter bugurensis]GHA69953.1 hypothetical protein GCM10007067_02460 [Lysobacter bugurensis]
MTTDRPNADELENLSALFDDALDADAARFARKRLGHDAEWQQACGRWQLIGDALRGQATAAAPADFALRVHDAVAREPVPVPEFMPVVSRPAAGAAPRRRAPMWIGGALAASLAAVAVFVARPPVEPPAIDPASSVVAQQAAEPGAVERDIAAVSVPQPGVEDRNVAASASSPSVDPAPAVVASSADDAEPRVARRVPRAERRVLAARTTTARDARDVQRDDEADARVAELAPDPFRPATEIVTRPWPRAVLPNSQAAGALTASFEAPNADARSFYPFEPPVDVPVSREP